MIKNKANRRLKIHRFQWKSSYNWYSFMWFRYHSKFFGALIKKGKKITAFKFFLSIKNLLKIKESLDPYYVFLVAMLKVTPSLLIIPIRVGASRKGIAVSLSEGKKITFGVKWIVKFLKDKNTHLTAKSIADLLCESLYGKGGAIERKVYNHRLGLTNRYLMRKAPRLFR